MMRWSKKYVERDPVRTQTATAGEDQIAILKQFVSRCEGQIASLKQSVARCDGQIASLKQQVRSLQESNDQLARNRHDLDVLLKKTLKSWSWRITYPLRAGLGFALTATRQVAMGCVSLLDAPISEHPVTLAEASAADQALARTGKFPSQAYLAAIALIDLTAIALRQRLVSPKYSIVILQLNQAQLTINCINSILRNTPLEELEVVVVDNGSSPENIAALTPYKNCIKLLEVGVNRHYGEGNNLGIEYAKGEFVILMNNDIVVTAGWLETITVELKEGVGAVGPCLLYLDELVQEAGGFMMANGSEERRYRHLHTDVLPTDPFECDYASAALLLMRRRDFIAVGGFDLYWEPAYYEDVDLCLKLRTIGLKILCCPAARVFHIENATSSDRSLNLHLENIVNINKAKFAERWGPYLLGNAAHPVVSLSRPRAQLAAATISEGTASRNSRPRALIHTPSEMKLDGSSRFILSTAAALAQAFDATIVFTHPYSALRLRQLGAYFGLNVDKLKVSTFDMALSDTNVWDCAFVFGNSAGPTIPAPSKCSFYLSEFPSVSKPLRGPQDALRAGYVYIRYGKSISSRGKRIQRRYPPIQSLNKSTRKLQDIGSAEQCRTLQCRKTHMILVKVLRQSSLVCIHPLR